MKQVFLYGCRHLCSIYTKHEATPLLFSSKAPQHMKKQLFDFTLCFCHATYPAPFLPKQLEAVFHAFIVLRNRFASHSPGTAAYFPLAMDDYLFLPIMLQKDDLFLRILLIYRCRYPRVMDSKSHYCFIWAFHHFFLHLKSLGNKKTCFSVKLH